MMDSGEAHPMTDMDLSPEQRRQMIEALNAGVIPELVNPVETREMENGTAEIGLRGRVQGWGYPS
jgi:hypothetical protein